MKLKHLGTVENAAYLQHLRDYRATGDVKFLGEFMKAQKQYMVAHWNLADEIHLPYTYTKRGVKKWLIEYASVMGLKFVSQEEWIDWSYGAMNTKSGLGEVTEEMLSRWYADYKREFNKYWNINKLKNINTRQDGDRIHNKSKWSEIFKGKSKDEIADIIKNSDLSKQMKYKLRKDYLKK